MNRLAPASKFLLWLGGAIALTLLTGCEFKLTNLTPASLPENPSQIYTLSLRVTQRATAIAPGSVDPHVIVDGQNFQMKKSSLGDDIYEFEYQLPQGRDEVAYYYLVTFKIDANGQQLDRETYTEVQHTKIARRNVLALTANRGPVGSRIGVLGRGFGPQDVILVNSTPARTVYESPNSISFYVPALEANKNYQVSLAGPGGSSFIGTFRIDASSLQVAPGSVTLRSGDRQNLTFTVPNPAPAGGLLIDITTDVPDSIIMPEVVIPPGQLSISVPVQGGQPGNGSLFLKGFGAGELSVPVRISPR